MPAPRARATPSRQAAVATAQAAGHACRAHAGHLLPLGSKQRAVLAVLLFEPNKVVRRSEIVRLAWGTQPDEVPGTIDKLVGTYISHLRVAIRQAGAEAEVNLRSRAPGWLLEVDDETIDWHRFGRRVEQARRAGEAGEQAEAVRLLRDGLEMLGRYVAEFEHLRSHALPPEESATAITALARTGTPRQRSPRCNPRV